MAWACGNLITKRIGAVDTLALVASGSLVAAPPLLLLSCWVEGSEVIEAILRHLDWRAWGAILYQSYPNTMVGFGIWVLLMQRYFASAMAPLSLMIPVSGMLSATLVLGESMPWWKITAGVLVLAGLGINQWDVRRRAALR